MKANWNPRTEPPKVPETANCIPVLCVWEDGGYPEVMLYWPDGTWTDTEENEFEGSDLPYKWTHLPDTLDAFE